MRLFTFKGIFSPVLTLYNLYTVRLLAHVRGGLLPRQIALILDGNRRFARLHGLDSPSIDDQLGADKPDESRRIDQRQAGRGFPQIRARLLFLCTGNYYRSRFAEILFNALAQEAELNWIADSRGIATERLKKNLGPILPHAVMGLETRGIVPKVVRFPEQLREDDLRSADRIIALNEPEHRRLLEERFPWWADRVEYWQIKDVGLAPADIAMAQIEEQTKLLIWHLSQRAHPPTH